MRDHGLDDALTLLHEVGLELLGEVRALDCDDLRAMGLSAKDASTLRSSLGLDATPPGKARPGDEVASLEAMLAEAETAATAMQKLVRGRSSRRNHAASPASPAVPTPPAQPDAAAAAPAAAANLRSDLPTDLLMPDAVADEEKRPGNKGRARAASMIEEINAMIEEDRMNKSRPPRRARHHSPHRGSRGGS